MAFLDSFFTYLIQAIVLMAAAVSGVFIGKYLRKKKEQ